jgi:DNA-directed RNA polymerase specialized sigma subunit
MRHIYCFIRQDVNWKCYAYLNNPSNRFHRNLIGGCAVEKYSDYFFEGHPEEVNFFDEEKLKVIEDALPYLPATRQTIMMLYFKYGFSYKKIAQRFGTSNQAISIEVKKSLESLKKIVHAQKKLDTKALAKSPRINERYWENMDAEMQMIFRLRYEQKHSFASIAEKMNITQGYVQQQYVIAHRRLGKLYHHKN